VQVAYVGTDACRTDNHLTTKIFSSMGYQIFFGTGLRSRAFGAQELRYKRSL